MKIKLIIALLCLKFWANAQENKVIDITSQGVKIGGKVPDEIIPRVLNYKSSSFKLSDFKGKWVIIDFWATWCGACLNMRPTMQKLVTQFEDKLTFISVTYQSEAEVKAFFDKQKAKIKTSIPEVVADALLQNWFPHRLLPHYVWIDPNGIVKAITGSESINEEQIRKMFVGNESGIKRKRDFDRDFDFTKDFPYYTAQDSTIKVMQQSSLTGLMLGVPSQTYSNFENNTYRMSVINLSLWHLYRTAYSPSKYLSAKMIEMKVRDSSPIYTLLRGVELQEWMKTNAYCYQIVTPKENMSNAYKLMQDDLARMFPQYKAELTQKNRPCWVLEVAGDTSLLRTKGEKPFIETNDKLLVLKNAKLSAMITRLTKYYFQDNAPLFLQDDLDRRVDIELHATLTSVNSLNNALKPYGLALVNRNRIQDVLVITDTN